jgi:hypothetical protein
MHDYACPFFFLGHSRRKPTVSISLRLLVFAVAFVFAVVAFVFAVVVAFAFLVVIPVGNLLLLFPPSLP